MALDAGLSVADDPLQPFRHRSFAASYRTSW